MCLIWRVDVPRLPICKVIAELLINVISVPTCVTQSRVWQQNYLSIKDKTILVEYVASLLWRFILNIKLQFYFLEYYLCFSPFCLGLDGFQGSMFSPIIWNFVGFRVLSYLIRNQEVTQSFQWLSYRTLEPDIRFFGFSNVRFQRQLFLWQALRNRIWERNG